jgi:hypothetical protein
MKRIQRIKENRSIMFKEEKMRKAYSVSILSLLLFVLVLSPSLPAKTFVENTEAAFTFEKGFAQNSFQHSQKIFQLTHAFFLAYQADSMQEEDVTDVYGFKGKSLRRAFLYSLIIPGSGELYAGSKIKAALFFGLDVAFWALYFNYHGKGKDKEDEYEIFADEHWSREEYTQWLIDSLNITSDTAAYWDEVKKEWTYLSHHLPDSKTQQYYEMIGKYEQFSAGWDDWNLDMLYSGNRDLYLNLRRDSNDLLNKAKYSAMFSLANHILSAFDAAISVKRYNKKGERFSQINFKMRLVKRDGEVIPRLSADMKF